MHQSRTACRKILWKEKLAELQPVLERLTQRWIMAADFTLNGDTFKKGNVTLSENYELIDTLKQERDVELSVFYGDTRVLTTLKDSSGKREINTKMSKEVYDTLQTGKDYYASDLKLFGTPYSGYYVPLYQPGSDKVVGSIFCGRSQEEVNEAVRNTIISMMLPMLLVFVIAIVTGMFIVTRIVKHLDGAVGNLGTLSDGILNLEMKKDLVVRKDEVGVSPVRFSVLSSPCVILLRILRHHPRRFKDFPRNLLLHLITLQSRSIM